MKNILIVGATSAIAEQVARKLCTATTTFILAGRNEDNTRAVSDDLRARGAKNVHCMHYDFSNMSNHPQLVNDVYSVLPDLDLVFIAYGSLPDQSQCEQDVGLTLDEITNNYTSVISLLTLFGNKLAEQGHGVIAVISSVAGDRGRQSNYIYGSAKAGLTAFLQGLRNRLSKKNVHVLTIKPGFVDTPMTKDFNKGFLWVGPDKVAEDIVRAIYKRKNVLYTPWYWQWIMLIIKSIPESIFKKMNL